MPLSNIIGTYGDVRQLLATALQNPGMVYTAASKSDAITIRARCHKLRSLLAKENAEFGIGTIFDDIVISLNENQLTFGRRSAGLPGVITDAAGNQIEILPPEEIGLDLEI